MHKSAQINVRIEPSLKISAEKILDRVGLSPAEVVRLLYKQILLHKGLPFDVKIPNRATVRAMKAADAGKYHKAKSVDQLFDDLT